MTLAGGDSPPGISSTHIKKSLTSIDKLQMPLLDDGEKMKAHLSHASTERIERRSTVEAKVELAVTLGYSLAANGGLRRRMTALDFANLNPMEMYNDAECMKEMIQEEPTDEEAPGQLATTFNLTGAILGAGVLAMPFAFQLGGWFSLVVLALMSAVSCYTAVLISECLCQAMEIVPPSARGGEPCDWPLIGYAAFGQKGKQLVNVAFLGELYFILMSYLVVNSTNVQVLIPWASKTSLIGVSGVLSFLLLFCPFWILSYFSLLGLAAMGLTVVLVVVTGLQLPAWPADYEFKDFDAATLSQLVGIILFGFVAHSAVPSIYMPMAKKETFSSVSAVSFGTSFAVYAFAGIAGYLFFAGSLQQNVIGNIGRDLDLDLMPGLGVLPLVASAAFALKLQLSFPLFAAPLLMASEAILGFSEATSKVVKLLWRCAFMALTTIFAMLLQDHMADCLALTGCLFSMCTALIFPTLFYYRMFRQQLSSVTRLLLSVLLVGGFYFLVTGTASSLSRILSGS